MSRPMESPHPMSIINDSNQALFQALFVEMCMLNDVIVINKYKNNDNRSKICI